MDVVITVIAVILVIFLWIMLYDSNRFVVRHYSIRDNRIRKPVKAVVLADLHNKRYGKENERLLEAIDELRPDMILIAGDLLTARPKESLDVALELVTKLSEKYPVYYGNGNHEHRLKLYPETYGDMGQRYEEALQKAGIDRLVNTHTDLAEYGISLYGSEIDKLYYRRFGIEPMEENYLRRLLGQPSEEQYTILIAHNPDYFPYPKAYAIVKQNGIMPNGAQTLCCLGMYMEEWSGFRSGARVWYLPISGFFHSMMEASSHWVNPKCCSAGDWECIRFLSGYLIREKFWRWICGRKKVKLRKHMRGNRSFITWQFL